MPLDQHSPPNIRSNHEDRDKSQAGLSVESLLRLAHATLDSAGVELSPSKVTKLVRTYKHQVEASGYPFLAYLTNAAHLQHARDLDPHAVSGRKEVPWADPTGETAIRQAAKNPGRGDARAISC